MLNTNNHFAVTDDQVEEDLIYMPVYYEPFNTHYVTDAFCAMLDAADGEIEDFITKHSKDGTLTLSASDSLQLQQLMADQSIAAQTGTSTLKTVKDSIMGSARNI